jgi:predicted NBD/HSP70 family sugar kinase
MNTLAVDIGGTKFAVALFEADKMIRRESRPTDREGARDWMLHQVVGIAREWKREASFERCGIGFGGPVDFGDQRVAFSTHIGGWNDFKLTAFLADALGVPAIMDNDANAGALGEAVYGAGRGHDPLFYMTLSTGIGGGIYAGGKIWRRRRLGQARSAMFPSAPMAPNASAKRAAVSSDFAAGCGSSAITASPPKSCCATRILSRATSWISRSASRLVSCY